MSTASTAIPPGIYTLADHLDGALAAGEDLLGMRLAATADLAPGVSPTVALADAVRLLQRHEATLLLHLLQARRRAAQIDHVDSAVRSVLKLIAAETGGLLHLVATFDPERGAALAGLADVQQFLRDRGVIAEDSAGLGAFQALEIGPAYRIGGMVRVGPLLDMAASALDLLDRHYELYPEDEPSVESKGVATEAVVIGDSRGQIEEADAVAADVPKASAVEASEKPSEGAVKLTAGSLAAALDEVNRRGDVVDEGTTKSKSAPA